MSKYVLATFVTLFIAGCGDEIGFNAKVVPGTLNPSTPQDGDLRAEPGCPDCVVVLPTPTSTDPQISLPEPLPEPGHEPAPIDPIVPEAPGPIVIVTPNPPPVITPNPSPTVPPVQTFQLAFQPQQTSSKVDIVWTIDNSASMADEAARVRQNFGSFAANIEKYADVKFAVLSHTNEDTTGVRLSAAQLAKGYVQVNRKVESTNYLAMAASVGCAKYRTDTDRVASIVCDRVSSDTGFRDLEDKEAVGAIGGSLTSFFRSDAKRVYVFVTDDNAEHFVSSDFKAVADIQSGTNEYSVFSFRGIATKGSCFVDGRGSHLENLAYLTGGQAFDICDADWTANFNTLFQNITRFSVTGFDLGSHNGLVSVHVDDVLLSSDSYTVISNKLYISKDVQLGAQSNVVVKLKK